MKNGSKEREGEDLAQENRRASVLALYSKNLNQEEIAQELKVDQSTISRDMRHLREEAKRKIIDVTDNLSFEFLRYLAVTDEIARELWKLASKEHPLNNNSANTGLSATIKGTRTG